jgi:hypothetical protein
MEKRLFKQSTSIKKVEKSIFSLNQGQGSIFTLRECAQSIFRMILPLCRLFWQKIFSEISDSYPPPLKQNAIKNFCALVNRLKFSGSPYPYVTSAIPLLFVATSSCNGPDSRTLLSDVSPNSSSEGKTAPGSGASRSHLKF